MERSKSAFRSAAGLSFTPSALAVFRAFAAQLDKMDTRDPWIPGFVWFTSSKMGTRKDGPIDDLGPGLDLGGFRLSDVTPDDLTTIDGHRALVQIPEDVLGRYHHPVVDYGARVLPTSGKTIGAFSLSERT